MSTVELKSGKPFLSTVKGDREYMLVLPENASLGELCDVLFEIRSNVIERIIASQPVIEKSPEAPISEEKK